MKYQYGIYAINGTGYMVWIIQNPFVSKKYIIDENAKTIELINVKKQEVESELEKIARKESTLKRFDKYWKINPKLTPDTAMCRYWLLIEHNLKEDDRIVIRKCARK